MPSIDQNRYSDSVECPFLRAALKTVQSITNAVINVGTFRVGSDFSGNNDRCQLWCRLVVSGGNWVVKALTICLIPLRS